eukprot:scaffold293363_cov28-Tisochrysis_lutea.AAC.2
MKGARKQEKVQAEHRILSRISNAVQEPRLPTGPHTRRARSHLVEKVPDNLGNHDRKCDRTMTVIEMVIREMPPSIAAAPMSAKLPGGLVE